MNVILKSVVLASVIFNLTGCASVVKRGVIAMKISNTEAHVGIGQEEVSVGDHVELYRNECTGKGTGRDGGEPTVFCQKISTGHGSVTKIYNQDYSVVKFPSGTKFSEGDMIEKYSH